MDFYQDKLNQGAAGAEPKNHPAVREGFLCLPLDAFDAVIFDLDGTLVDSMGMWGQIDVEFLARFGLETPPDLQKLILGLSWDETEQYFVDHFPIGLSTEEIGRIWVEMAAEKYRHEIAAKDGAVEFVRKARQLGLRLGVASSNHLDLILDALGAHGLTDSIDAITTCGEAKAGKPDPAVYLLTAEKLGVNPERCLIFEDIPEGILAGKRAGMTAIAVEDSNSAHVEEEKMKLADGYIRSYNELRWV